MQLIYLCKEKQQEGVGIRDNVLRSTPFDEIFRADEHQFDYNIYELTKELSI